MPTTINILFIGDLVGNAGVDAAAMFLPSFKEKYKVDVLIVNGENAMDGKSISAAQLNRLFDLGVHVVTTGNHVWERWHIRKLLDGNPNLLRPANYPKENAGRGYTLIDTGVAGKVGVVNLQGRVFMFDIDCPFKAADRIVAKLRDEARIIFVDMHAEATAEKIAMGWYLDGRVSAVVGTHTHVQTADARILPGGTGYITDVGMTGPYDSVVGMRKDIAIKRFIMQTPHKYEIANNDVHMCGVFLKVEAATGKTIHIESFVYPEFNAHGENN